MKFELLDGHLDSIETEAIVIMLTEEQLKSHGIESKLLSTIDRAIRRENFRAELYQAVSSYIAEPLNADILVLVGLGKKNEVVANTFRNAMSVAVDTLKSANIKEFTLLVPELSDETISALAEGAILSNYIYDKYRLENKDRIRYIKKISLLHHWNKDKPHFEKIINRVSIICENTIAVRNLVNENSEVANPEYIANVAKEIAGGKLKCEVLDEKEIEKLGMGLIMAVGKGSRFPPRLVIMEYYGNENSGYKTALIGKGITFDSGGMNLKPTGFMETMKSDMAGAASVIYTMKTLRDLEVDANVIAVIPLCENMIGPNSYRPGDVIKSYSGITVEVGNTDAEGRLVLGDAISYAKERFKPDKIIDLATLTGSILMTFGGYIIGLFTNDDKLAKELHASGERTSERVWQLPLYSEYVEEIKSEIADVNNISQSKYAGAINGAAFLAKFYGDSKWAHLDIAGMAWMEKKRFYLPRFATGVGVRLLADYLASCERETPHFSKVG